MARLAIKSITLKRLFALSGNQCAFPGCTEKLTNDDGVVFAYICHIEAANAGEPRYNKYSNDEHRRSFSNLILLCDKHHKITDDEIKYPTQTLLDYKASHESKFKSNHYKVLDAALEQILKKLNQNENSNQGSEAQINNNNTSTQKIENQIGTQIVFNTSSPLGHSYSTISNAENSHTKPPKLKSEEYLLIENQYDLNEVSKNFLIIEKPLVNQARNKNMIQTWDDIKQFIDFDSSKLLNFEKNHKIFAITGLPGSGKSSLLFKNIELYLNSMNSERKVIFLHPNVLSNITEIDFLNEDEKYLLVIDGLVRNNKHEKAIILFNLLFDLLKIQAVDVKVLLSLHVGSLQAIRNDETTNSTYDLDSLCHELKAASGRKINNVFDQLVEFHNLKTIHPNLDFQNARDIVLQKAKENARFISNALSDATQFTPIASDYFTTLPDGIHNMNWRYIATIPNGMENGVMACVLLLTKNPSLQLCRNSLKSIIKKGCASVSNQAIQNVLEYIWNYVLSPSSKNTFLKGFDPAFQESIVKAIKDPSIITEYDLNALVTLYKDFFESLDFYQIEQSFIQESKDLITQNGLIVYNNIFKAIELLNIDFSERMLTFISNSYQTKEPSSFSLTILPTLKKTLDHHWRLWLWDYQVQYVSPLDFQKNQTKQKLVYNRIKKIVYSLYSNEPAKLHSYSTELRRFCLPAFDERSMEYRIVADTILEWFNKCNSLHEDKDLLAYQAIAKFYLEIKDFEKATYYADKGLSLITDHKEKDIISLYIIKSDILLTQATTMGYANQEESIQLYNSAIKVLAEGYRFIYEKVPFNFQERNQIIHPKIKNAIRAFITHYCRFINKSDGSFCFNLGFVELKEMESSIRFVTYNFPQHKDTIYAYSKFIIQNLTRLYSFVDRRGVLEEIGQLLLKRYQKYSEPKIRDAIRDLIRVIDRWKINISDQESLTFFAKSRQLSPHVTRSIRWILEDIQKKAIQNESNSSDTSMLETLIRQPVNYDTALNISRACFIYGYLNVNSEVTQELSQTLTRLYESSNKYYHFCLAHAYSSWRKQLKRAGLLSKKKARDFNKTYSVYIKNSDNQGKDSHHT